MAKLIKPKEPFLPKQKWNRNLFKKPDASREESKEESKQNQSTGILKDVNQGRNEGHGKKWL